MSAQNRSKSSRRREGENVPAPQLRARWPNRLPFHGNNLLNQAFAVILGCIAAFLGHPLFGGFRRWPWQTETAMRRSHHLAAFAGEEPTGTRVSRSVGIRPRQRHAWPNARLFSERTFYGNV
jgi:hypothetical protein